MLVLTSRDISIYLIIGNVQKVTQLFPGVDMMCTLQSNNQIIKINDQISQITILQIRPRLACIGS